MDVNDVSFKFEEMNNAVILLKSVSRMTEDVSSSVNDKIGRLYGDSGKDEILENQRYSLANISRSLSQCLREIETLSDVLSDISEAYYEAEKDAMSVINSQQIGRISNSGDLSYNMTFPTGIETVSDTVIRDVYNSDEWLSELALNWRSD